MISPMLKVLLAGRVLDRRPLLEAVRRAGVVHVEPLEQRELPALPAVREELALAERALAVLAAVASPAERCPPEHTPPEVVERVLAVDAARAACGTRRRALDEERRRAAPWGHAGLTDLAALRAGGLHAEFYHPPAAPYPKRNRWRQ